MVRLPLGNTVERPLHRSKILTLALSTTLLGPLGHAQEPAGPGAAGPDTSQVTQLPEIGVTVTGTLEPLSRVPYAVGVLDRDERLDFVRDPDHHRAGNVLDGNRLPGVPEHYWQFGLRGALPG